MYNFENYITEKLNAIRLAHTELLKYKYEITTEQAFLKMSKLEPDTVYFIIKYLGNTQTYEGEITPIQIIALTEQNGMEDTRFVLGDFATTYNYQIYTDGTTKIKQEYQSPVVMSNFNEVSYGYRSVIFVGGTLYIQNSVSDIEDLSIDGTSIDSLGTNVNYSMTGNTQPIGNSQIATTVKNMATLNISLTLPSIATYTTLITKIMNISSGTIADSTFEIKFKINGVKFGYFTTGDNHLYVRLQSMSFITSPNSIPQINVGFIV